MKILDDYIAHEEILIAFEKKLWNYGFICYIACKGNLNEKVARKFFAQILIAIILCTEEGILHGDIKE